MKKVLCTLLAVCMLFSVCSVWAAEDITADPMVFKLDNTTVDLTYGDPNNSTDKYATLQNGQYFEYTVNTEAAGDYMLHFSCGTNNDVTKMDISVNGTVVLDDAPLADTNGYGTRDPHELGIISLVPGANVIKFQTSGGAVVSTQFSLTKYKEIREDITANPMEFPYNTNTVSDYSHASQEWSDENYITLYTTHYAEYTLSTKQRERYTISVSSGGKQDGVLLDVSVNGEKQIANGKYVTTGGWQVWADQVLGTITLEPGDNVIRFENPAASTDSVVIRSFTLTKYTEPDVIVSNTEATRMEAEDYTTQYVKTHTAASGGKWVNDTWADSASPIYIYAGLEEGGYFNLEYVMLRCTGASLSVVTVYIDGKKVGDNTGEYIENLDSPDGFNWQYGNVCKFRESAIWLEKGTHTIMIDIASCNGSKEIPIKYKFQIDYLEFVPCTGVALEEFDAVTKEGGRLPFAIKDGFTAYAKATVLKMGETDESFTVLLAQYDDDNRLVQVKLEDLDIAGMAPHDKKTFMVPMTFKGNGGKVKAFVMNTETLKPLDEEKAYWEYNVFPEEILTEETKYVLTNQVKNANGEYYADYSIHDDKYDIDAIFYDSVVGEQSKVFAFIGVPKGATEENPVPAVVCVHGGAGVAFSEWVKLWNDRGYAAIAMTLTGDGPDANPGPGGSGSFVSKFLHPYAGLHCWGEAAFRKDIHEAAMYQNVINVVRAHNVLRGYPGVDETKVGITGISWGGVTTTTTIGVDQRFIFAAPVYGAGYLDESETYFSDYFDSSKNTIEWDPANFAAQSDVPTLFINSNDDEHFSINSTTKTAGVTKNSKISIHHRYGHNYTLGWGRQEIYTFADAMVQGYDPFITISGEKVENGKLTAKIDFPEGVSISSVSTYYITTEELPFGGKSAIDWKSLTAYEETAEGISVAIPDDATFCYASVKDNKGNVISTKYIPAK